MMSIPLVLDDREMDIFIILEQDNIERIQQHDPAEIVKSLMGPYAQYAIRNIVITYASAEDKEKIFEMQKQGVTNKDCIQYLCRGWQYRPDRGDATGEYEISPAN